MFYNNSNNCYHEQNNKKQGYCVKYVQEICCYPSYYNENDYNDDCNKKILDCCKDNDFDCNKNNYKKQNRCCCFNNLFRW